MQVHRRLFSYSEQITLNVQHNVRCSVDYSIHHGMYPNVLCFENARYMGVVSRCYIFKTGMVFAVQWGWIIHYSSLRSPVQRRTRAPTIGSIGGTNASQLQTFDQSVQHETCRPSCLQSRLSLPSAWWGFPRFPLIKGIMDITHKNTPTQYTK